MDDFPLDGGAAFTSFRGSGESVFASVVATLPGYLETISIRLRAGRLPTDVDDASGLRGTVINESAARALFPDGPAVGRQFTRASGKTRDPWMVLGVIAESAPALTRSGTMVRW